MIDRLFLSVGAMKAGTTWLHRHLAGHPGIHFSPEKEIHYFADPQAQNYMSLPHRLGRYQQVVRNLKAERMNPHVQANLAWYARHYLAPEVSDTWYEGLFADRPPRKAAAPWVADFSNLYAVLDAAGWAHAHRLAREVRAVYTLRHPGERLWSALKFSYEFAGRADALPGLGDADYDAFLDDPGTLAHADYAGAIQGLRRHLPQTGLIVLFMEETLARPLETLRRIEGFLDLDPHAYREDALQSRVNPSRKLAVPGHFADRANRIAADQIARLTDMGFALPDSWHVPLSA